MSGIMLYTTFLFHNDNSNQPLIFILFLTKIELRVGWVSHLSIEG